MKRLITAAVVAIGVLPALALGTVMAGSREAVGERVDSLKKEAEALERAGRIREAEELWREAEAHVEKVDRPGREHEAPGPQDRQRLEMESRQLQRHLEELGEEAERHEAEGDESGAAEIRKEMEQIQRQIAEIGQILGARHEPEPEAGLAELERRIGHLRQAAEHLEAAGMNEWAREAFGQAEEMERNFRDIMERRKAEEREERGEDVEAIGVLRAILEAVDGLRAEVRGMHEEVRQIREILGSGDEQ